MRHQVEQINQWLLMLLAFWLPLSTSAVSVSASLIVFFWLIEGKYRNKLRDICSSPLTLAVLVYLAVLIVGLCWTESLPDGLAAIRKQWKILLAPIFLATIRWEWRWRYVAAFLAGVTTTMLVVSLDHYSLLQVMGLSSQQLAFHTETVQLQYTPMLAFAIYLLGHQLLWGEWRGWRWWALLCYAALLFVHLFLTRGRAGHVAFFVLLAMSVFQFYRRHVMKACVLLAVLVSVIFLGAYRFSPVFQERIGAIHNDLQGLEKNSETSVGLRLHYWKISWELIKESPWVGVGTGDFSRAYVAMNNKISPNFSPTNNPHNQYLFAAAQNGMMGLLGLLGLFFAHFYQSVRTVDGWERIRFAFPVFFMVIMCFESYLNLVGTGFLFSLLSALLFKKPSVLHQAVAEPADAGRVLSQEARTSTALAGKEEAASLFLEQNAVTATLGA